MPLNLNVASEQIMNMAEPPTSPERRATIRALNKRLRRDGLGGRVLTTAGIAVLPPVTQAAILLAVSAFDAFDGDNDPHDEHDFALLEAAGQQVMFKIDAYDVDLAMHSPDPADPTVTCRVMTIMLSSEY